MKNRVVLLLLSIVLVSLLFSPNAFSQDTVVRVVAHYVSDHNNPYFVDIFIENGQNMAGYQVMLQFDSNDFKASNEGDIEIDYGDYLPADAFYGKLQIIDDDPTDSLKVILFAATSHTSESNGDGFLARLTFNKGTKTLSKSVLTLFDGTLLSNRAGETSVPRFENSKTFPNAVRDLVVESVQAIPIGANEARPYYSKGEKFELRATIRNVGNSGTGMNRLKVYGPAPTTDIDTTKKPLKTINKVKVIEPNNTVEITLFDINPLTAAETHYYKVCVEAFTNESNKGNNCSDPIKIIVDEGSPDLIVESVEVNSIIYAPTARGPARGPAVSEVSPRQALEFYATVKNQGIEASAMTVLKYYRSTGEDISTASKNDELLEAILIPPLSADSTFTKSIRITAPETPGTYTYRASVDSVKSEKNRDNNSSDFTLTVRGPDLVIESVLISSPEDETDKKEGPISVAPEDKFNLHVVFKNIGTPTSKKAKDYYYRSANAVISETDIQIGSSKESFTLPENGPVPRVLRNITAPDTPGIYYYGVCIDKVEGETNTYNNCKFIKVIVSGDRLEIPEDLISDVAFTPNYTFFVLNPKFAKLSGRTDTKTYIAHKCIITLPIEDYSMLTLAPPSSVGEQVEDIGGQIGKMLAIEITGKVKLVSAVRQFIVENLGTALSVIDIGFNIRDIEDPNDYPQISMTYYPNTEFGFNKGKTIEGDVPILFVIQNTGLSSMRFEVEQQYYEEGNWVPIEVDFTAPWKDSSNNPFINIYNTIVNIGVGAVNELLWEPLSKIVRTINNNLFVGNPNLTVKYGGEWNLEETFLAAAPSAQPMSLADYPPFQQLSPEAQAYLLQLLETPNFGQTGMIAEAQQVPEKTTLLANYPNPFNPETWIPYQLAESADVTLTIYDFKGHVVRRLDLGHQRAGMYHGRSRAAYWDGRNAVGEPVASGVYFYTLTAGEFTATRKMLIRK